MTLLSFIVGSATLQLHEKRMTWQHTFYNTTQYVIFIAVDILTFQSGSPEKCLQLSFHVALSYFSWCHLISLSPVTSMLLQNGYTVQITIIQRTNWPETVFKNTHSTRLLLLEKCCCLYKAYISIHRPLPITPPPKKTSKRFSSWKPRLLCLVEQEI